MQISQANIRMLMQTVMAYRILCQPSNGFWNTAPKPTFSTSSADGPAPQCLLNSPHLQFQVIHQTHRLQFPETTRLSPSFWSRICWRLHITTATLDITWWLDWKGVEGFSLLDTSQKGIIWNWRGELIRKGSWGGVHNSQKVPIFGKRGKLTHTEAWST